LTEPLPPRPKRGRTTGAMSIMGSSAEPVRDSPVSEGTLTGRNAPQSLSAPTPTASGPVADRAYGLVLRSAGHRVDGRSFSAKNLNPQQQRLRIKRRSRSLGPGRAQSYDSANGYSPSQPIDLVSGLQHFARFAPMASFPPTPDGAPLYVRRAGQRRETNPHGTTGPPS